MAMNLDKYYKEMHDGYRSYKTHRQNIGWDSNAKKSSRFYFGDQWDSNMKQQLLSQNRPPSTFNMILPAVDLICGHHLESQVDITAKAVDRTADPYIARLISQAIKNIEQSNEVAFERKAQFLDGIITGVGIKERYWKEDYTLNGKLIVTQQDPRNFYFDPNFKKYDYSDGNKLYRDAWLTKKQIEMVYGKDVAKDLEIPTKETIAEYPFDTVNQIDNVHTDYGNPYGEFEDNDYEDYIFNLGFDVKNNLFRVVEEYEKRYREVEKYYDIETNQWMNTEYLFDDEKELIKNSTIKIHEQYIHLTTMIGVNIVQSKDLEYETPRGTKVVREITTLFDFFFPYFFNGKYMGLIENLWYPQEEVNKRHSTVVNILSTIGSNQVFFTDEFMGGESEKDLKNNLGITGMNIKVGALYDKNGRKTYEERRPPVVPQIYENIINREKDDVKYISGAQDQLQGISERRESGVAKRTEIERGQRRLSPLISNFRQTQKIEGKAYIWWIQNLYTEEKIIRIYGERLGEEDQEIELNKMAMGRIFNDVSIGFYDIVIVYEGTSPTERDRTYYRLIELANTAPQYADIIGEIVLDLFDLPEKNKIKQKWLERQEMIQQQQMMGMTQQQNPNRGPIQSATRPSRGPRRESTVVKQ